MSAIGSSRKEDPPGDVYVGSVFRKSLNDRRATPFGKGMVQIFGRMLAVRRRLGHGCKTLYRQGQFGIRLRF